MNQRIQIVLLIVISCFIVVLIGFNLAISRYGAFWKREKANPNPPVVFLSETFNPPVEEKKLEAVIDYGGESNHPVFALEPETPVYAIFSGKISYVGQKETGGKVEFENIIINNEKEKLTVSYLLAAGSKILVKENDLVSEGQEIAKISQEKGPGCLGGGNLGVYLFKDGKPVKLTKEMLK